MFRVDARISERVFIMAASGYTWSVHFINKRKYSCLKLVLTLLLLLLESVSSQNLPNENNEPESQTTNRDQSAGDKSETESESRDQRDFYSFSVRDMKGKITSLKDYRGKVTLVVNVASECGYTDGHYKALVQLQNELGTQGKFTVMAFPCNQFGAQEPQDNAAILRFAQRNYKANFPIFAKINVINTNVPPAWRFLTQTSGHAPTWNFWKYLVDGNGKVVNAWGPWMSVEQIKPDIIKTYQENLERGLKRGGEL